MMPAAMAKKVPTITVLGRRTSGAGGRARPARVAGATAGGGAVVGDAETAISGRPPATASET
jgi:hypothetical protein